MEDISFHDNRIHKIEFVDEDFATDLILDIDYITEWMPEGDKCKFRISPAHITFKNVSNLNIVIRKSGFTMLSYLETILDVKKELIDKDRYRYKIILLSENFFDFEASEFSVVVVGKEYVKSEQHLTKQEREVAP